MAFGGTPFSEECCDCGLVHIVEYKIENGKLWVRYDRDEAESRKARARRKADGTPTLS